MRMVKYDPLKYSVLLLLFILYSSCIKNYAPPAIQAANNYLVVDGFINTAPNSITTITLSRSRNLADTTSFIPEHGAQVQIADSNGAVYPLIDSNNTGKYSSNVLNLIQSDRFRILITTSNGHQYQSAFVSSRITPAIDSVNWQQSAINSSVGIYVSSHDPLNNTHYYRWDYVETWQHNSPVIAYWVLINGLVVPLDADYIDDPRQTYQCWTTAPSKNIVVANSLGLSQDVISLQPLTVIPYNDERITIRYSINVSQYAITEDAYNYWVLIQKNSQALGSLFDLTPSQLSSNITCVSNPNEPVIGYASASTVQQQRIFITNSQVGGWTKQEQYDECNPIVIPTDPNNFQIYTYPDTSYAPWYFTGDFTPALIVTKRHCVDCRLAGGNTSKPPFW
jgi:hypothetical protein